MVQREVADRFFAAPSTKAYGSVSVLVQLAAERTGFHPVSRTVFRPPPNVDSALVAFRRVELPERFPRVKDVVEAVLRAPAQDASQLDRAVWARVARAGRRGARRDRAAAGDARRGAGAGRVRRARGCAVRAPAPAKINLALVVGPLGPNGKHEVATVFQRVDLADRVAITPGERLSVRGFPGDTLVRDALTALAAAAGAAPRWTATITKHIPVASGLGGGSSDAATALRLANETLVAPLPAPELRRLAAGVGADVPFFLDDGPQLGRGDGSELERLELPQDYWVVLVLPNAHGEGVDRCRLPRLRRPRRRGRLGGPAQPARERARGSPTAARPGGTAAERPGLVAARRGAPAPRRLPCRRQRRGAGRLRALPPPAPGPGGAPVAPRRRPLLADRPRLVRLSGRRRYRSTVDRPATIEHRSTRLGRRLRDRRLRIALLVALVEGILVLVGSIDWWVVVLLAILGVALYVMAGRDGQARGGARALLDLRGLAGRSGARADAGARPHGVRGRRARADRRRRARRPAPRPPIGWAPELWGVAKR